MLPLNSSSLAGTLVNKQLLMMYSANAVHVLLLSSSTERKTERLCILLPVSISHCIVTVASCREIECLPNSVNSSIALCLAISPIPS